MASLQEQLLKAGLTTKQKARQANTEKRKKNKQKRSGVAQEATLQEQVKQELQHAQSAKKAKDNALNEERKKQIAEKEQGLRIQQILQHHQLNDVAGDNEYNYTFNTKIKKIAVDDLTYKALVNGRLALCGFDEVTYIVTAETAQKVAELDNSIVLVKNDKVVEEESNEEDPYAQYQIPDDLMW
ncbi:DUF2058 domain-containing protein [Litorilituus lipolyticus]|uniref:DUF2058 domain-containing protein n=1 Tax=Litorilituus lipolyticus TaxID=2491017 RepID=A0A502KXK6_9GAMM|nr:DUF2058 domain-containing protein [Litorilituus lipolyticus]TPH16500.1 DUF2058 domain-containing protein [Litorilituus lipolyticus]